MTSCFLPVAPPVVADREQLLPNGVKVWFTLRAVLLPPPAGCSHHGVFVSCSAARSCTFGGIHNPERLGGRGGETRDVSTCRATIPVRRMDKHNILRPEALESLYYLYWITGEEGYRDQAWRIFQAFEKHCRVDRGGYAGLEDVMDVSAAPRARPVY